MVDLTLNPNDDHETEGREKKADANLAQWRKRKDTVDCGIDQVIRQRNADQNENWVGRLYLRGDQIHAQPMQVHLLGLQRPFDAIAHSPERPEEKDEKINHRDASEDGETFTGQESFPQITETLRRDVDHFVATGPEKNCRDHHRDAGNSESPARTERTIRQHPRTNDGRNEGASVNRKIKPTKHFREQMLVGFAELITNIGRNAGLDSARADADQCEADRQHGALPNGNAPRSVHKREGQTAKTVNDGEPEDGSIFTEPAIGNDRANYRKIIDAGDEVMGVFVSFVGLHGRERAGLIEDVMRHEDGQDRLHAVVIETLGRFVADNVRDARRHPGHVLRRRGEVFGHASVLSV